MFGPGERRSGGQGDGGFVGFEDGGLVGGHIRLRAEFSEGQGGSADEFETDVGGGDESGTGCGLLQLTGDVVEVFFHGVGPFEVEWVADGLGWGAVGEGPVKVASGWFG